MSLDPLCEPAHRCLMALYARAGRRSAALRQYRACTRALERELGVSPSEETRALYERIRAEGLPPAEEAPAAPVPTPVPDRSEEPGAPPLSPTIPDVTELPEPEGAPFVAREGELARLRRYLQEAHAGRGQVALVVGEAGSGKTALLHEFARLAQEEWADLVVAGGTCDAYTGTGDPYRPFREMLSLLAGDLRAGSLGMVSAENARRLRALLPAAVEAVLDWGSDLVDTLIPGAALTRRVSGLEPPRADWLDRLARIRERQARRSAALGGAEGALSEQTTNVLEALARERPLLLVVDDAQWADGGSIHLLFHLGRRLARSRILFAVAYRPEDVALGRDGGRHPLEPAIHELTRTYGEIQVDLDRAGGARFVEALLDAEPNRLGAGFRERLARRTGGHALFTVELLRSMQERGDLVCDEGRRWVEGAALDWEALPARVEAVIEERVGRLDGELRDLLEVASVEGERFTAQAVARALGQPERAVLRALPQELGKRHRLVWEEGEVQAGERFLTRYRFAHALFQRYLYDGLNAGERRLLHGEVGSALEGLWGQRSSEVAVELAHHYAEGGQAEKAVEYLLQAGETARLSYANEEAEAHFQRALGLLEGTPLGGTRRDWRLAALTGLSRICLGVGKPVEGERCVREAIVLGREIGLAPRALVRLYYWLQEMLYWQDRGDEILDTAKEGLALLGEDDESVEAVLMMDHVYVGYNSIGSWQESTRYAQKVARVLPGLPYSEDLRAVYVHFFYILSLDKRLWPRQSPR